VSEVVVNGPQFIAGLEDYEERFHKMFRKRIQMLMTEGMRRLIAKTPVQTGAAVASYVASVGSPTARAHGGFKRQPGTNKMSLGSEQNRGAAAGVANATLSSVNFSDPFATYYITNADPNIGGLETGSLPRRPFRPRSPAGMFGVTVQELMALLNSGSI